MVGSYLDFEEPIAKLEANIERLRAISQESGIDNSLEIKRIEKKVTRLKSDTFKNLSRWGATRVARHNNRPSALDYIRLAFHDFIELHGDRRFADCAAIVGGFCSIDNRKVMLIAQQKGRTAKERAARNFGMPRPEGYRKAERLMKLAEKFQLPVVTMIDTPGAYPGVGAEERGQAEAIARNLYVMSSLRVPIIATLIGEGGSGGALALGVADCVMMLEYSVYSVISPEGCAAILWKDYEMTEAAAEALKLTATDLYQFKIIDEIVKEPLGGAHQDHQLAASILRRALRRRIDQLSAMPRDELLKERRRKFRMMGRFSE